MTQILFQRLPGFDVDIDLPDFATDGAAGMDIRANFESRMDIVIQPMERALIPTGFAMALPAGFEAQVRPRSGLALKHGVTCLNTPGTIDADYRGPVGVILVNLGGDEVLISHGMRIAQMVISQLCDLTICEVSSLPDTARGTGGFGSTGVS
ncbi:MAG: dUTP diphosphatase [Pseudomonadota bacterium]